MELNETTAIITGSTGTLGRAIALALAEAGANCICHYHSNQLGAQQLVEKIQAMDRRAVAVCADLSKPEQAEKLFAETILPLPTILINSAAVFLRQKLSEVTFVDSQATLNTNLVSPILLSRRFVQGIPASESIPAGKIINLVDVGGIRPWADYTLYCASKAGLIAATKSLAKELAPNICVNAIAPGIITWQDDLDDKQKSRQLSHIPAGRAGTLDELTSAVLFLLQNDYITGQVLNVDGGRCI
jgi:NAD(P)-dependent dehydrogenase (short-subunit alcohol dehydrogenase family)